MNMLPLIPYIRDITGETRKVPVGFTAEGELCETARRLNAQIRRLTGLEPVNGIRLENDPALEEEAYSFAAEPVPVMKASAYAGFCRGLATLLMLARDGVSDMPAVIEKDGPASGFRGLMVDLARFWHPMPQVLSFLDACFMMKLNVLHLHFCDDQLFTLPSKAFPKLATPGASYTLDEIELLKERAKELGVTLLPEIDMPGHAGSFLRAYPDVFGTRPFSERALCMGRESVYDAVDTLLGEVIDMFPDSPMIHIGGDEVVDDGWKTCEDCAAYMKAHDIPDVKVLYTHSVGRIARMVMAKGRRPVVWEGFPRRNADEVPKETLVMPFECAYYDPRDLAKDGFELVNASWKPLYYTNDLFWPWCDIYRFWELNLWQDWVEFSWATEKPIVVDEIDRILGAQIYCWGPGYASEWTPVLWMCLALAERLWVGERLQKAEEFQPRIQAVKRKLDALRAQD